MGLMGQKPPRGVPHLRIPRGRETLAEREFLFRIPPHSFGIPTIRISVPCSGLSTSTANFATPSSDTLL